MRENLMPGLHFVKVQPPTEPRSTGVFDNADIYGATQIVEWRLGEGDREYTQRACGVVARSNDAVPNECQTA